MQIKQLVFITGFLIEIIILYRLTKSSLVLSRKILLQ